MSKQQINVRVDSAVYRQLQEKAGAEGKKISSVFEQLMESYIQPTDKNNDESIDLSDPPRERLHALASIRHAERKVNLLVSALEDELEQLQEHNEQGKLCLRVSKNPSFRDILASVFVDWEAVGSPDRYYVNPVKGKVYGPNEYWNKKEQWQIVPAPQLIKEGANLSPPTITWESWTIYDEILDDFENHGGKRDWDLAYEWALKQEEWSNEIDDVKEIHFDEAMEFAEDQIKDKVIIDLNQINLIEKERQQRVTYKKNKKNKMDINTEQSYQVYSFCELTRNELSECTPREKALYEKAQRYYKEACELVKDKWETQKRIDGTKFVDKKVQDWDYTFEDGVKVTYDYQYDDEPGCKGSDYIWIVDFPNGESFSHTHWILNRYSFKLKADQPIPGAIRVYFSLTGEIQIVTKDDLELVSDDNFQGYETFDTYEFQFSVDLSSQILDEDGNFVDGDEATITWTVMRRVQKGAHFNTGDDSLLATNISGGDIELLEDFDVGDFFIPIQDEGTDDFDMDDPDI